MLKIILFLLCISLSTQAAKDGHPLFASHISTPASTIPSWSWAFQIFPGANGMNSMVANSLSLGLFNRLEIGTVPVLYAYKYHRSNFNIKYNFYKGEKWVWAAGFSTFRFKFPNGFEVTEKDGTVTYVDQFDFNVFGLALNRYFSGTPFSLGCNFNVISFKTKSDVVNKQLENEKFPLEWIVDFATDMNPIIVTIGMGQTRANFFDDANRRSLPFGMGATVTYLRQSNWFHRLSLGYHHLFTDHKGSVLLSFSI